MRKPRKEKRMLQEKSADREEAEREGMKVDKVDKEEDL
jgi:hypothetical protein